MINYQLYIENQLMDVDEKLSFPLNKILEELNDPTLIKVEWSKTIQLPMTDNNNLFFGNYFRLDNVIAAGSNGSISGVYFDPTQKLNFRIMYNSDIVMEGYAKMLSNNNSSGKKAYELSLYGKLGEVLNKIKNISLNPTDTENYIGDVLTTGLKLNKELVKASFEHDKPVTDLSLAGDLDIIGFAMTNRGLYEEFNSKDFVNESNKIEPIDKYINDKLNVSDSSSYFPNGLGELACRELRSYYQKPYIYVNKAIQLVRDYINANSDYTFKLSPTWFNDMNPYYSKLIMMLNSLDVKKSDTMVNSYNVSNATPLKFGYTSYSFPNSYIETILNLNTNFEQYPLFENNKLMVAGENTIFVVNNELKFRLKVNYSNGGAVRIGKNQGISLTFYTQPNNGSIYKVLLTGPNNDTNWMDAKNKDYDQVIVTEAGNAKGQTPNFYTYLTVGGNEIISVLGKHILKTEDADYKLMCKVQLKIGRASCRERV